MCRGAYRGLITRGCLLAAVAAIGASAASEAAPAEDRFATVVASLKWSDNDLRPDRFDGKLGATESRCLRERAVRLYRSVPGRDRRIAAALTNNRGAYRFDREDPGSGRFYLRVKKRRIPIGICERARSKKLRIVDLAEI